MVIYCLLSCVDWAQLVSFAAPCGVAAIMYMAAFTWELHIAKSKMVSHLTEPLTTWFLEFSNVA